MQRLSAMLLIIGTLLSAGFFWELRIGLLEDDQKHLESLATIMGVKFQERMNLYEGMLNGAASLYAASQSVEVDEWRAYVRSLQLKERFPAVFGVAVAVSVKDDQLQEFIEFGRNTIDPNFSIKAYPGFAGGRLAEHIVFKYVEPEPVIPAIRGLDLATDEHRSRAAHESRANGRASMTKYFDNFSFKPEMRGSVLFVPFYRKEAQVSTTRERLENHEGWMVARLNTETFFSSIENSAQFEVDFTVYDGITADPNAKIFSTCPIMDFKTDLITHVTLADRQLTFAWGKSKGFRHASAAPAIWAGALAFLITLILTLIIEWVLRLQQRAEFMVITRTKELEKSRDALQEKSKMLEQQSIELAHARDTANAATVAKSSFLASMSHEIRTPLTSIVGYAEAFENDSTTRSDRVAMAKAIVRNGHHLLRVINDVLDFSKIEAGMVEIETIQAGLGDLVSDLTKLVSEEVSAKNLVFNVDYAFPLPRGIKTDPTKLKQILFNLISNAVKFTKQGGVTLRIFANRAAETISFAIKDTGIGMNAEQSTRLFKPFSQAALSTTREFGGTGLGLAISNKLAQALGGEIQLESAPGHGSTFTLTVPTGDLLTDDYVSDRTGLSAAADTEHAAARIVLNGRILVAEDGPSNRDFITFVLRKAGLNYHVVENGQEAVDAALAGNFDLVLMDINMPVMDGLTATANLRKRGYTQPIIALSANVLKEEQERCLVAGCNGFIAKPFITRNLLSRISTHLQSPMLVDYEVSKTPPQASGQKERTTMSLIAEDKELVAVVDLFFERSQTTLTDLRQTWMMGEWQLLTTKAHSLKGAAASLRFETIRAQALQIEEASRTLEIDKIEPLLEALVREIEVVRQWWVVQRASVNSPSH